MSSNVREMRQEVRELTADLRVFNRVVATSKVGANDLLVLLESLGLPREMRAAINELQMLVATINVARTTARLLEIELGPIGWILLIGGTLGGLAASQQMEARRPRY